MKVVITLPAYNEEKTIGKVLKDIKRVMNANKYAYSALVVDDGSQDNTAHIARKEGAKVIGHQVNLGLAETFRTEMKTCMGMDVDIIVHTDADGQYRAEDIPKLINEIKNGNDLVLGSRFMGKIETMPILKRLGNKAFSRVISKITKQKITDGQTGFRAFTKKVAALTINSDHTYTQEQIIRASKAKLKIKEIPIYFAKRGGNTKSRLMRNPFDYALKAGVNLLRIYRDYEPLKFFGYTGGISMLIGLIMGLWIAHNIIVNGTAGGIPRVILSALALTTGLQILLFGFLADMKKNEK